MPLLTASPLPGHVVSVYAGGAEDGTSPGELPIGLPPHSAYGVTGVRKYTCFMKTFLFEELAEQHAGRLSLSHIYPGLVDGPTFYSPDMPTWFHWAWWLLKPLASLYMTNPDDCGQVMLYLATSRCPAKGTTGSESGELAGGAKVAMSTNAELGGGSYTLGQRADERKGKSYAKVRKEDTRKLVWDHTMETLSRIEKENANAS